MAGRVRVFTSSSDDPFLNLALEEQLFRRMGTEDRILFLWQSRPCVVIGRFQNPWVECDLEALERDGADLVRRQSGGGTVYHDGGNSNFTFLGPAVSFDPDKNLEMVTAALDVLGIHAEISSRHDILAEGFKVSGSAFRKKRDRALHHGTLLFSADREKLSRYLAAPNLNIDARGVASVRSRVVNLADLKPGLDHHQFCGAVTEAFLGRFDSEGPEAGGTAPPPADLSALGGLETAAPGRPDSPGGVIELKASDLDGEGRVYRETLRSWEWRFGKTPAFAQRLAGVFRGRPVEVVLQVRDGLIEGVFPGTEEGKPGTEEAGIAACLNERLAGVRYGRRDMAAALGKPPAADGEIGTEATTGTEEPEQWLLSLLQGG